MKTVVITSQAELDALPRKFPEFTVIEIRAVERIVLRGARENASAVLRGNASAVLRENASAELWGNASAVLWENASAELWGNASAVLRGNASAVLWENASAVLWENASAELWGNASAELRENASAVLRENASAVLWENASAELRENASAELRENASAVLRGNASAELRGNASAELRENASAELRGNASAVLRGNASAELRGNASAVLWGNASAELWGNASAELWGNAFSRLFSEASKVELFGSSIALLQAAGAIALRKSETAHILRQAPDPVWTVQSFIEREGIPQADGSVTLFKRVSSAFLTQEGQSWQTAWLPGTSVAHPSWEPAAAECGGGKFHACSRPYFCDEFRDVKSDRYIAVRVAIADLFAWQSPSYPHKIAFRVGEVLYECDRRGKPVAAIQGASV